MKRDLLNIIEEHSKDFSKGQRRIADYITKNYDKAAYMTASRLGSLVDVSESTVVRFAIELGFDGYPDMQRAMQEFVRTRLTSFQRIEVTNNLIGDSDILEKVLSSDIDKINHTCDHIDRDSFNDAVNAIINTIIFTDFKTIFIGIFDINIKARADARSNAIDTIFDAKNTITI